MKLTLQLGVGGAAPELGGENLGSIGLDDAPPEDLAPEEALLEALDLPANTRDPGAVAVGDGGDHLDRLQLAPAGAFLVDGRVDPILRGHALHPLAIE